MCIHDSTAYMPHFDRVVTRILYVYRPKHCICICNGVYIVLGCFILFVDVDSLQFSPEYNSTVVGCFAFFYCLSFRWSESVYLWLHFTWPIFSTLFVLLLFYSAVVRISLTHRFLFPLLPLLSIDPFIPHSFPVFLLLIFFYFFFVCRCCGCFCCHRILHTLLPIHSLSAISMQKWKIVILCWIWQYLNNCLLIAI